MTKRFNSAGYVIEETDGLGQPSKIERTIDTNLATKATGPCGCLEDERTFDTRGNVISITDRLNKTESWQYRTFANASDYDPLLNQMTQYTDKLGRVTGYGYDAVSPNSLTPRGNMTTMTNALNQVTTYAYDGFGRVTSVTDALNHATTMGYDANGYVNAQTDALNHSTTFLYDLVGNQTRVTDALGRQTQMTYDNLNRMLTTTDPANATTTYAYDENGNTVSITDALSRQWTFTHDKKNRQETMKDPPPLNRVTWMQYDAGDQLLSVTSPSGRTMRYTYDERGQRKTVTDGLGGIVMFGYDNRGALTALSDQRGNTTTFAHDELFRLTGQRDPLGRLVSLEYDAVNNVSARIDRMGRRTMINYDSLNRPQSVVYVDATVNYIYDAAGRWTQVSDASGTITWQYDNANRLSAEITNLGTVSYGYNNANQRTSMTAADRAPVAYGYDVVGRLQTIAQGTETFTYGYDTLSRRTSLARPNGVTTNYQYDEVNRLKRLTHTNSAGTTLEDLQYEFNLDDEINKITSLAAAPLTPQSKTVSPADAANRVGQFGSANFSFDAEGRTTSKSEASGANSYLWDARGRLTQTTLQNGQAVNYGYDALGRRTSLTSGGSTTTFQHDGADVVIDRVTGGSAIDYLTGPDIDNVLRQTGGTYGTIYYLQDQLGSTTALTSTGGTLVEQQQYEAFGANAGSVRTRYGYTGRERDELTGLMYYRARWFDPSQGRFLSEDPISHQGGANFYAYVDNDPIRFIDPLGQQRIRHIVPRRPWWESPPPPPLPSSDGKEQCCEKPKGGTPDKDLMPKGGVPVMGNTNVGTSPGYPGVTGVVVAVGAILLSGLAWVASRDVPRDRVLPSPWIVPPSPSPCPQPYDADPDNPDRDRKCTEEMSRCKIWATQAPTRAHREMRMVQCVKAFTACLFGKYPFWPHHNTPSRN
jgi:RHS repeat-associated protein